MTSLAVCIALAFATGTILGTIGGGGTVLTVPILVQVLDVGTPVAVTSSLLVVAGAAAVALITRRRRDCVSWGLAFRFAIVALPGAWAGTHIAARLHAHQVLFLFGLMMVVVALLTWRGPRARSAAPLPGAEAGLGDGPLVAGALGVGLLTGLFGVGGGFLIVPLLLLLTRNPTRWAIGTSIAMVLLISIPALLMRIAAGTEPKWAVAVPFAAVSCVGALVGSRIAHRLPELLLRRSFAGVLAAVGAVIVATGGSS